MGKKTVIKQFNGTSYDILDVQTVDTAIKTENGASTLDKTLNKKFNVSGGNLTGPIGYTSGSYTSTAIDLAPGDQFGNYIGIGSGGLTVIGGGESTAAIKQEFLDKGNLGTELMVVASDTSIQLVTNVQGGVSGKKVVEILQDGEIKTVGRKVLHAGDISTTADNNAGTTTSKIPSVSGVKEIIANTTPKNHTHNASDINAGTLSNDRITKASVSAIGIVQLSSSVNSTSETLGATAKALKQAYDLANHTHPYLNLSEVVTSATANKVLKLNDAAKLPASITGDAHSVDGKHVDDSKIDTNSLWTANKIKTELDNRISSVVTSLDWKESVNTFNDIATTYPKPEDGWTVNVKDTDITYRYSGTSWIAISANAIPVVSTTVNGLMTKEDKTKLNGIAAGANNYVHPSDANNRHVTDTEKSNWNAKASTAVVTTSANGLMIAADKTKLNGIATNANNYVHPTTDGNKHIPSGGVANQWLKYSAAGTAVWTALPVVSTSADGLMIAADKTKLNGIAANANNYVHPSDANNRHVTDTEKSNWNAKASTALATSTANGLMSKDDKVKLDNFETIKSFTKSITLTTAWQDYGIEGNQLVSGSYMVQISSTDNTVTSQWYEIYTGTMSWYSGSTNASEADEILLHKAGHAPNLSHIYLRTKRNPQGLLKLQISFGKTLTTATNITIKFRRMM